MSSPLLDFLAHDLVGPERDAVTRAFYEYAQGDPHSHPVGMATLLIACARQMNTLPPAVQGNIEELRHLVKEVTQLEKDLLEKLTRFNFLALTDLKDEGAQLLNNFKTEFARIVAASREDNSRVKEQWNEVVKRFGSALNCAHDIHQDLKPMVESAQSIARDFHSLQDGLKLHEESTGKIVEGVKELRLLRQEEQGLHEDHRALICGLTNDARANWLTFGFLGALTLSATFQWMKPWQVPLAIIGALILIQMARCTRKPAVKDAESRAWHWFIAKKIRENPALLVEVRQTVESWLKTERSDRSFSALVEWKYRLDHESLEQVLHFVCSDDLRAARLRQFSPFLHLLSDEEKADISKKQKTPGK